MIYLNHMKKLSRTTAMLAAVGVLAATIGCRTSPQPPLLGDRGLVPSAYSTPTDEATAAAEPLPRIPDPMELDSLLPPEPDFSVDERDPLALDPLTEPAPFDLPPAVESEELTYTVQRGDSLWKIAQAYGITHQELAAYNNMDVDATLKIGAVLRIPPSASYVPPDERREPAAPGVRDVLAAPGRTYEVVKGDSLWKIAQRFNVTVRELQELNDLSRPDVIVPGQTLVLPESARARTEAQRPAPRRPEPMPETPRVETPAPPTPPVDDAPTPDTAEVEPPRPRPTTPPRDRIVMPNMLDHTVLDDDTLRGIAEMYGTTVEKVKEANPTIDSDEDLIPNMRILVPLD